MKRLLVVLLFAAAAPLAAQEVPFSVGARADVGFPTGDDMEDADTGFGFGVEGVAQFTPIFGVYAGYSAFSFSADAEGVEGDYNDSGFELGAHVNIPVEGATVAPWVRAGAVYRTFEIEARDSGVSVSFESDASLGFEIGAGFDYPLGEGGLLLRPAARYRAYSADLDLFGETVEGDVGYFAVGVGLSYAF
jgi:hypothetical protein